MDRANTYVRPDNGLHECRKCRARVARSKRAKAAASKPETQRRFRGGYPVEMTCRTCGLTKPTVDFGVRRGAYKGTSYRNRSCQTCTTRAQREYLLRTKYGIGVEQLAAIHEAQGGVCALCDGLPERTMAGWPEMPAWSVDHDHVTGRVRGLLCQPCNVAVGFFEVRIDVDRMRRYLAD